MKRFSFKTFTSFLLVLTFLTLVISGVMLFLSPPGRVAHWTDWTLLGLDKEEWGAVHIIVAIAFLTGSLFHLLKFNWKVFLHYLRTKRNGFQHGKELSAALGLSTVVVIGTLAQMPPFVSVLNLHEEIKAYWEEDTGSPPIPHMELMSLREFASTLQLTETQVIEELTGRGLSVRAGDQTLKDLAASNGRSPEAVFNMLQRPAGGSSPAPGDSARRGLGRLTLDELAAELGISTPEALRILAQHSVNAAPNEKFRDIAARSRLSPHELLEALEAGASQTSEAGRNSSE